MASQRKLSDNHTLRHDKTFPKYEPPSTGILTVLPASWVPYAELARIDKPTGIYLFYFPHLFGTLYATRTADSTVQPWILLGRNAVLLMGTVFFRAAACAWNDNMDREYDRQVLRCCLRPLARGALSPIQAHVFTVFLASLAAACLFMLPTSCRVVAAPSIVLLVLYPFAKRFTDFPQAILGIQVAIGVLMGLAAVDMEAFVRPLSHLKSLASIIASSHVRGVTAFYAANVCWTIVYDTIYAQQDVEDDAKAGVRSIAVRFRGRTRTLLWTIATLQVFLLIVAGWYDNFGRGYVGLACGGTAASLAFMLTTIDLTKPTECAWWFKNGCWFVGLSIAGGLALECLGVV